MCATIASNTRLCSNAHQAVLPCGRGQPETVDQLCTTLALIFQTVAIRKAKQTLRASEVTPGGVGDDPC